MDRCVPLFAWQSSLEWHACVYYKKKIFFINKQVVTQWWNNSGTKTEFFFFKSPIPIARLFVLQRLGLHVAHLCVTKHKSSPQNKRIFNIFPIKKWTWKMAIFADWYKAYLPNRLNVMSSNLFHSQEYMEGENTGRGVTGTQGASLVAILQRGGISVGKCISQNPGGQLDRSGRDQRCVAPENLFFGEFWRRESDAAAKTSI